MQTKHLGYCSGEIPVLRSEIEASRHGVGIPQHHGRWLSVSLVQQTGWMLTSVRKSSTSVN